MSEPDIIRATGGNLSWYSGGAGVPAPLNDREISKIMKQAYDHYVSRMIDADGRPLGEADVKDIDNDNNTSEMLTVSEGVSYALLRAVWMNDKVTFDKVWNWARTHLQRKNIREVYDWTNNTFKAPRKRDNLFAWRWVPNFQRKEGVVIDNSSGAVSRDGFDVASDADLDIAAALIFAANRWGGEYLAEAKLIVRDIWEKLVIPVNGKPYLVGGDQFKEAGEINPSYFRPAYFRKLFPLVDPGHQWNQLAETSYEVLNNAGKMQMSDEAGRSYGGTKNLPPNWVRITPAGGLAESGTFKEDQLFGWDAFRTLFAVSMDYAWTGNEKAKEYLKSVQPFFADQLKINGRLNGGYNHDGSVVNSRRAGAAGLDREQFCMDGPYLSMFFYLGDRRESAMNIFGRLYSLYAADGYWGFKEDEYFGQNWAWLGLALMNSLPPDRMALAEGWVTEFSDYILKTETEKGKDSVREQRYLGSVSDRINELKAITGSYDDQDKAHAKMELIPLLISRAAAGDRELAKVLCLEYSNYSSDPELRYFSGVAKILLGELYLAQMNDGTMQPTKENINRAIAYITEGQGLVEKNPANMAFSANDKTTLNPSVLPWNKGKRRKAETPRTIDYYILNMGRILALKLKTLRGDKISELQKAYQSMLGNDTTGIDANIRKFEGYEDTYKNNHEEKAFERDRIGLKLLKESARIQLISFGLGVDVQDGNIIKELIEGRDGICDVIKKFEDISSVVKSGHENYFLANGLRLPVDSFEYFNAQILLADLIVKYVNLSGNKGYTLRIDDKDVTALDRALELYGQCAPKEFSYGTYRKYISAWANMGSIHYAITFNKFESLTLNGTTYAIKADAMDAAIKYLTAVRDEGMTPSSQFLACQDMLDEANLRIMRMKQSDLAEAEKLCRDSIAIINTLKNEDVKNEMLARANLLWAKAIAYDLDIDRSGPDSAIEYLKGAYGKLAESDKAAKKVEGLKDDASFNIDYLCTRASFDKIVASIYKEQINEAVKYGETVPAELQNKYDSMKNSVNRGYKDAWDLLQKSSSSSDYERRVRPYLIKFELAELEVDDVDIDSPCADIGDKLKKFEDKLAYVKNDGAFELTSSKTIPPADDPYVAARKTALEIKIRSKLMFARNNFMELCRSLTDEEMADYVKKIRENNEQIQKLIVDETGKEIELKDKLSESEVKNLYRTITSTEMVMLGIAPDEKAKNEYAGKIINHSCKALNVAEVEAILPQMSNPDWLMPYNVGEALLIAALSNKSFVLSAPPKRSKYEDIFSAASSYIQKLEARLNDAINGQARGANLSLARLAFQYLSFRALIVKACLNYGDQLGGEDEREKTRSLQAYQGAVSAYQNILNMRPRIAPAQIELSRTAMLEAQADVMTAHIRIGDRFKDDNHPTRANEEYRAALDVEADIPERFKNIPQKLAVAGIYRARAEAKARLKNYKEALSDIDAAIQLCGGLNSQTARVIFADCYLTRNEILLQMQVIPSTDSLGQYHLDDILEDGNGGH